MKTLLLFSLLFFANSFYDHSLLLDRTPVVTDSEHTGPLSASEYETPTKDNEYLVSNDKKSIIFFLAFHYPGQTGSQANRAALVIFNSESNTLVKLEEAPTMSLNGVTGTYVSRLRRSSLQLYLKDILHFSLLK